MDIAFIVSQMGVLFILLAVGFAVGKLGILTPEGNRVLTKIVICISLPCTVLHSVFENKPDVTAGGTLFYLLMCFVSYAVAFAVAIPLVRLSRGDKANHGLLTFMSVFSNSAFMGYPAVIAIFGTAGAYYTALYNIPFNLLSYSIGIMLVAGKSGKFDYKLLLNPPLVASLLVIPVALTDLKLPYVVTEVVRLTGGITSPGAMIVIGSTLAYVPLRSVFSEWRIAISGALKLLVIPVVTWLVFRHFITDELMLGVLVVLSAMPAAAASTMIAIEYKGNERVASAGVFTTTLLCVVTVPLLVYLLL